MSPGKRASQPLPKPDHSNRPSATITRPAITRNLPRAFTVHAVGVPRVEHSHALEKESSHADEAEPTSYDAVPPFHLATWPLRKFSLEIIGFRGKIASGKLFNRKESFMKAASPYALATFGLLLTGVNLVSQPLLKHSW